MHVPTGGTDTIHPALGGSVTDFGGSLLASEEIVHDHHDIAVRDTVVSFPMQGPAVPGRWADSAPSVGQSDGSGAPNQCHGNNTEC